MDSIVAYIVEHQKPRTFQVLHGVLIEESTSEDSFDSLRLLVEDGERAQAPHGHNEVTRRHTPPPRSTSSPILRM